VTYKPQDVFLEILMTLFLNLSNHLAFDMSNIKNVIMGTHKIDLAVLHKNFPRKTAEQLDREVVQDLHKTNSVLRTVSDRYGALAGE